MPASQLNIHLRPNKAHKLINTDHVDTRKSRELTNELKRMKKAGDFDEGGKHAKILEGVTVTFESGFMGYTDTDEGKFEYKRDFSQKFDNVIYQMKRRGKISQIVNEFVN